MILAAIGCFIYPEDCYHRIQIWHANRDGIKQHWRLLIDNDRQLRYVLMRVRLFMISSTAYLVIEHDL